MRCLVLALILLPAFCRAQTPVNNPPVPPDWKTLYEQANAATKAWKERAQNLEAENGELKDRVAVLTDKLRDDPMRVVAEDKRRQQQLAVARASTAPPVFIQGKVLSVTRAGILVSCTQESSAVPDKLCFIEEDNPNSFVDGQGVNMKVAAMPEAYQYTSVYGAGRRVPRFHPMP